MKRTIEAKSLYKLVSDRYCLMNEKMIYMV
jgi:hypothetical protein